MSSITLSNDRKFTIKWMCAGVPYIDFDNGKTKSNRIVLNKSDIQKIHKELQDFLDFYSDDFQDPNEVNIDEIGDY